MNQLGVIKGLKFLQFNLGKSKQATVEVISLVKNEKIDIIVIQEPYMYKGKMIGWPLDWIVIQQGESSRAAIVIVNKDLVTYSLLRARDLVAIGCRMKNQVLLIVSIYVQWDAPSLAPTIEEIAKLRREHVDASILLGGDFNAKNPIWGGENINQKGEELMEFVASSGLTIINNPDSLSTYERDGRQSWIDLTIINSRNEEWIRSWRVVEEEDITDHRKIIFELNKEPLPRIKDRGYQVKYANWNRFKYLLKINMENMRLQIRELETREEFKSFYKKWMEVITNCCDESLKKKNNKKIGGMLDWWTQDLKIFKKKVRAARRRAQRGCMEDRGFYYLEYKRLRAKYKFKINKARRDSWMTYCKDLSRDQTFGLPYKLAVGKFIRPSVMSMLKKDGVLLTNMEDSANYLLETLFPEDELSLETREQGDIREFCYEKGSNIEEGEFSKTELYAVIKKLKNGKAPGVDLIVNEIIKRIYEEEENLLLEIYNMALKYRIFVPEWKIGVVTLLSKEGRDLSVPNSYRPICLLSNWGKIFEKMIYNRLMFFEGSHNIISENQFGFRPGVSSTLALQKAMRKIEINREENRYSIMISFDIKNAFNSLWHIGVIESMIKKGFPEYLISLTKDYFRERRIIAIFDKMIEKSINRGCPQGSCLGPFYWNLMFDGILELEYMSSSGIQAYADDLLLITSGNSRRELVSNTTHDVALILKWLKKYKLELDIAKTKAILLPARGNRRLESNPSVRSGDFKLKFVDHIRYLGVEIDKGLVFLEHIEKLRSRMTMCSEQLRRSTSRFGGLQSSMIKDIYLKALERAIIYAAPIWFRENNQKLLKKINSIQRPILLAITKAYRTTSTVSLQVLAGVPPLTLRLKKEIKYMKLLQLGVPIELGDRVFYETDIEKKIEIYRVHPRCWIEIKWKIYTDLELGEDWEIFTDGSKSENGVGCACVIYYKGNIYEELRYKLRQCNTVFQAEMVAILMAFRWLNSNKDRENIRTVNIVSDSKSALQSLQDPVSGNLNVNRIKAIYTILNRNGLQINLKWIKAHEGHYQNERADSQAKQAVNDGKLFYMEIPPSWIKKELRNEMVRIWTENWEDINNETFLKNFILRPKEDYIRKSTYLNQIMTGHGQFKRYLYRFGKTQTSLCSCGEEGSVLHYFAVCAHTAPLRRNLSRKITNLEELRNMLRFPRDAYIMTKIMMFLEENIDRL